MKGEPLAFPDVQHVRYWPILLKSTEVATEVRSTPALWVVRDQDCAPARREIT
jgi:hypothetical protein